MSIVVVIRLCISISYRVIKLSVRSVEYHAELYRWYHIISVPWAINIVSVPRVYVTRTMTESVPAVIMYV